MGKVSHYRKQRDELIWLRYTAHVPKEHVARELRMKPKTVDAVINRMAHTKEPKRERRAMVMIFCISCGRETEHSHMHDQAHGIDGTHMVGSERFECRVCSTPIYKTEGVRRGFGDKFKLD